jgi:alpha/beta superfamily hydrolase
MTRPVPDNWIVETVRFPSGPYLLEGELAYTENALCASAVLAGPHPLLGGSMHNNVIQGIGDGLAAHGLATLRFNYRGVGQSTGPRVDAAQNLARFWNTSHIPEEVEWRHDVEAAARFLSLAAGALPEILVGYSFGCALLPLLSLQEPAVGYVLIAPPLKHHDCRAMAEVHAPILVVASDDDFSADVDARRAWFDRLSAPRRLVHAPRDNHFFRGHEPWLVETVISFLRDLGVLGHADAARTDSFDPEHRPEPTPA